MLLLFHVRRNGTLTRQAPPHSSRYTASAEHAPVPGTIREQRLLTAHDLLSGSSRTVDGSPADHASGDEHGGSGPPVPSSSSLPLTSARMEVGNTGVERSDIGQGSDNEGEEVVAEAPPGPSGKQRVEDNERGEDDAADDESETVAEVAAETAATTEIEADVRMKEQNAGKTLAHMGPREFHVTDVEVEGGEAESVADDVEASGMDHTLPSARQISPGNSAGVQATSIRVPADVVKILPESTGPINGWQGVGSGQRSEILDGDNEAEEGGGDDENIFQQELSVSATKVEHHGEVPGNGPPAPELSSNVLVGGEQRADEESIRAGGNHRPKVDEEGLGVGELDNFCAQDEGSKDERTVEVGSEVLPATPEISSHLSRYSQEDGTVIAPIDAADRATELSAIESVTAIASDDAIRKRSGDSCSSGSVQRMSIHLPQVDAPVAQGLESADEEDLVKEADAEAEPLIAEADDGDEQGNEKPKNGVVRTMDRTVEEGFPCHSVVNIAEVGSPAVGSQGEEEAQERDTVRGVEAGTAGPQNEDDADDNAVAEEEGDDDMIFLQASQCLRAPPFHDKNNPYRQQRWFSAFSYRRAVFLTHLLCGTLRPTASICSLATIFFWNGRQACPQTWAEAARRGAVRHCANDRLRLLIRGSAVVANEGQIAAGLIAVCSARRYDRTHTTQQRHLVALCSMKRKSPLRRRRSAVIS